MRCNLKMGALELAWAVHESLFRPVVSLEAFHCPRRGSVQYHVLVKIGCYSWTLDRSYSELRAAHQAITTGSMSGLLAPFPKEQHLLLSREARAVRRFPQLARWIASISDDEQVLYSTPMTDMLELRLLWSCAREASTWSRLTFASRLERTLHTQATFRMMEAWEGWSRGEFAEIRPQLATKISTAELERIVEDDTICSSDDDLLDNDDADLAGMLMCTTMPVYTGEEDVEQDLTGFEAPSVAAPTLAA